MGKTGRIKLKERTLENDIKYKAPLSYRYLRIIAWVCLIIAQIGLMAKLNIRLIPQSESQIGWIRTLGEFFSSAPLPLFLLANFAVIFQKREKWRYLLMFYGGVALLLYIVGNIVVLHFVYGLANAFTLGSYDKMALANGVGYFLFGLGHTGLVFNIFIDLFLCTLLFFFMNYKPKKLKGKQVYLFRSLIALPILYEIASITIKYFVAIGSMDIPFFCFFLLTSKPPLMFFAFLTLVVILKIEEFRHLKKNENLDFVKEHRKTNAHSFRFSLIIFFVFLIASVLDIIIYFVLGISLSISFKPMDEFIPDASNAISKFAVDSMGFGKASILFLVAPITLLFSYTKTHKKKKIDSFIPVTGVALIAIVYIEALFQILVSNITILMEKLADFIQNLPF